MSGPMHPAAPLMAPVSRSPWVAPAAQREAPVPLLRAAPAKALRHRTKLWPVLPELQHPPQAMPASAPPPLVRSPSHPVRGALPFALPSAPPAAVPQHAIPMPMPYGAPHLPRGTASLPSSQAAAPNRRPWMGHLSFALPAGVVPALGALPGLYSGLRQLGAAWGWQGLLLAERARCQAGGQALQQARAKSWAPEAHRPAGALVAASSAAWHCEQAALNHAITETRFRMASLGIEVFGICATALPQLVGLMRLSGAASTAALLRAAFPHCLLAHGLLGIGHALHNVWVLRPRTQMSGAQGTASAADTAWQERCLRLQQEAQAYHLLHGLLWLVFTCALAPLVWSGPLGLVATVTAGAALGTSVTGLLYHHICRAERYDAPRALWLRPPWHHVVFADAEACEAGYGLLVRHDEEMREGLRQLTVRLKPMRRLLLQALFDCTSVQLTRTLFIACARRWLMGQSDSFARMTDRLTRRHDADLARLWTAQAWHVDRQLQELRPVDALAARLAQQQLAARMHACVQAATELRVAAAAPEGARLAPPAQRLLDHKTHTDELRQAIVWAGRWRTLNA